LCNYFQVSYGEGELTQHQFNFNHFCKTYDFNSAQTYNALQILDRNSIISLTQQFNYQTKLQFLISSQALFGYLNTHKSFEPIIKSVLRTYGGVFDNVLKINIPTLSEKAAVPEETLLAVLHQLKKDGIAEFQHSNTDSELTFLQPREDDKTINRIAKTVEQQQALKATQIEAVIAYINDDTTCKSVQLSTYFGETNTKPCGTCSVCISKKKPPKATDFKTISHSIILQLEQQPSTSRRVLIEHSDYTEKQVLDTLKLLLEHNIIELTTTNTYKLKHT
jgi:ATP-dependent DNA helicase RecQ